MEKLKIKDKKKVLFYSLIVAMAVFILFNTFINASAVVSKESLQKEFDVFCSGFTTTSIEHMENAYKKFAALFQPGDTSFNIPLTDLKVFIGNVGYAFIIIHMLINIIQLAARGELIEQYWTKLVVNTAVAIIVIFASSRLISGIFGLGGAIISKSAEAARNASISGISGEGAKKTILNALSEMEGFSDLKAVLDTASASSKPVPYSIMNRMQDGLSTLKFVAWLPMAACIFLTFSSVFEIKVREIFTPIAVASIASGGLRSGGVRFLLKYLACFIKIAIYFIISLIGSRLMIFFFDGIGSTGSGIDMSFVLMLLSPVVTAMAMMQTGGLGDEILGV